MDIHKVIDRALKRYRGIRRNGNFVEDYSDIGEMQINEWVGLLLKHECLCDRGFEPGNYAEICKNENGSHRLIIYCEDDEFHSGEIQINFCPICGRKLN